MSNDATGEGNCRKFFSFPWRVETGPLGGFLLSLKSFQAAEDRHADVLYVGRRRLARGGSQTDSKMGKKRMLNILIQEIPRPTTSLASSLFPRKGLSAEVPTEMSLSLEIFSTERRWSENSNHLANYSNYERKISHGKPRFTFFLFKLVLKSLFPHSLFEIKLKTSNQTNTINE